MIKLHTLIRMEFNFQISRYLYFQAANIDLIDDKLRTALSYSIEQGHFSVSKYLIREKANLHVADYQGRNCIHIAAWQNNTEIMSYLFTVRWLSMKFVIIQEIHL